MRKIKPKPNNNISPMDKDIHLQNYRMAFDAMRAYHTSEVQHKRDGISVLNAFLASMIPVFGGVIYYIFSDEVSFLIALLMIGLICFIYYLFLPNIRQV